MQAQKSLSSISSDRGLWIAQYRQEIYERDRFSDREGLRKEAREEGLAEGRAEGIKQGKELGKTETEIKFIKNALEMGFSVSQIIKLSGLTEAEINSYRQK